MKKILTALFAVVLFVVPAFAADDCDHSQVLCYDDVDHYLCCVKCGDIMPYEIMIGLPFPHPDGFTSSGGCSACTMVGSSMLVFPKSLFDSGFDCELARAFLRSDTPDAEIMARLALLYYDNTDHYIGCRECDFFIPLSVPYGSPVPHPYGDLSAGQCLLCHNYGSLDIPVLEYSPSTETAVLPAVTDIVTVSIDWLVAFVLCIISNSLLLCFIIVVLVGLGLGLLKRVIHL